MNIPESRDFVVENRPICCDKRVEELGYDISNSYQHFVCRTCDKRISIKYWPLTEDSMRELKINQIINI